MDKVNPVSESSLTFQGSSRRLWGCFGRFLGRLWAVLESSERVWGESPQKLVRLWAFGQALGGSAPLWKALAGSGEILIYLGWDVYIYIYT